MHLNAMRLVKQPIEEAIRQRGDCGSVRASARPVGATSESSGVPVVPRAYHLPTARAVRWSGNFSLAPKRMVDIRKFPGGNEPIYPRVVGQWQVTATPVIYTKSHSPLRCTREIHRL